MPSDCGHQTCRDCAANYFTLTIKDKSIVDAVCPFCSAPKVANNDPRVAEANAEAEADGKEVTEDEANDYFARLDGLLRGLVTEEVHDLFQRKLRDRTLMKDENFKWCYKVRLRC